MRAGIALGSNLSDRLTNLREARKAIVNLVGKSGLASAIYETDPIDCEPGAQKFLNAVLEIDVTDEPLMLLEKLKQIEVELGRPGNHARNTSRKIDIDLLYLGDREINEKGLQLPHPRMHSRRFVLQPLADIRPDLILPGQDKTVRELLALSDESAKVVRLNNDWESP